MHGQQIYIPCTREMNTIIGGKVIPKSTSTINFDREGRRRVTFN